MKNTKIYFNTTLQATKFLKSFYTYYRGNNTLEETVVVIYNPSKEALKFATNYVQILNKVKKKNDSVIYTCNLI
ncbi:hypothetical protein OAD61_00010 [bacterium]|nr:hypothetical protein [bacterium]